MYSVIRRMIVLALLCLSPITKALVTVGTTPDCDHNNIADAVANVSDITPIVMVANDQVYTDDFIIDKQVFIYGGYASCSDAENGTLSNDFTQWQGTDSTTVKINANQVSRSTVILQRFEISNGSGTGTMGGGVDVKGLSTLLLYDSLLIDNDSVNGGGLAVSGSDARVTITDTNLYFNDAEDGAGLYCRQNAIVTIQGNSGISNNTATSYGGGILARSGCQVTIQRGNNADLVLTQEPGIAGNTADIGGGVAVDAGASVVLNGEDYYPARIFGNTARTAAGVVVVDEASSFESIKGAIYDNAATEHSGGFWVLEPGATLSMHRGEGNDCFDPSRCSILAGNTVSDQGGSGAAGTVGQDGTVNITHTHIHNNRADEAVVFSSGGDSFLTLESNLIYDNKPFNSGVIPEALVLVNNNGGLVAFHYNTLATNINQAAFKLPAAGQNRLNIFNSVIYNLGVVLDQEGMTNNIIQVDCSVVQESNSLTGNIGLISTTNPQFIDSLNHNFQLDDASVAIDMCDESLFTGPELDVAGQARPYDLPSSGNLLGTYDAGAYESIGDLIFKSGFE